MVCKNQPNAKVIVNVRLFLIHVDFFIESGSSNANLIDHYSTAFYKSVEAQAAQPCNSGSLIDSVLNHDHR